MDEGGGIFVVRGIRTDGFACSDPPFFGGGPGTVGPWGDWRYWYRLEGRYEVYWKCLGDEIMLELSPSSLIDDTWGHQGKFELLMPLRCSFHYQS